MDVSMPCIQPHQFTPMQNMHLLSHGRLRLMTTFRKFKLWNPTIHVNFVSSMSVDVGSLWFIRYADRVNAYWTGYFTSRPAFKGYVRQLSGYYVVNSWSFQLCFKEKKHCDAYLVILRTGSETVRVYHGTGKIRT